MIETTRLVRQDHHGSPKLERPPDPDAFQLVDDLEEEAVEAEDARPVEYIFSLASRRRAFAFGALVTLVATLASLFAHGEKGYFVAWLLTGGVFALPVIVVATVVARRGPRENRSGWICWISGHVVVVVSGLLILARVFASRPPPVALEIVGAVLPLVAMGLLGAPIAGSLRQAQGMRALSIDLLDVTAASGVVLAPVVFLLIGPLSHAPAWWFGGPALVIAVSLALFIGSTAFLLSWMPRGWAPVVAFSLVMLAFGSLDAWLQLVQVLNRYRFPAAPVVAVQGITWTLLLAMPLLSPVVHPEGLGRLSPRVQVRRRMFTPIVLVLGAPALVLLVARFQRGEPWMPLGAAAVLAGLLLMSTLGRVMTVNEAVHVYGELEDLAGEQRRQARTDPLTGLANRRVLMDGLPAFLARADRLQEHLCLAMLDLDHFKTYNDLNGHLAGDELLRRFGSQLAGAVRAYDLAARYGGEEFCLVLPATDLVDGCRIIDDLRTRLDLDDGAGPVTFSAGVAQWERGESMDTLLLRADTALYGAKAAGRDRVVASG